MMSPAAEPKPPPIPDAGATCFQTASPRSHMRKKLIIWGASGHAMVVADILRLRDEFEVIGMIDDFQEDCGRAHSIGLTILGGRDQLRELKRGGVTHLI